MTHAIVCTAIMIAITNQNVIAVPPLKSPNPLNMNIILEIKTDKNNMIQPHFVLSLIRKRGVAL